LAIEIFVKKNIKQATTKYLSLKKESFIFIY